MMRIGIIAADLSHKHGWAHYSLELTHALAAAGATVEVVAAKNSPLVEGDGIRFHPSLPTLVPRERWLLPKLLTPILMCNTRQLLQPCDLIHCCVEPFAPLAALVAGERPFFQGGIGSYLYIDQWQRPPLTRLYRWAISRSHLICISHYTARVAHSQFPTAQIDTVPLGIDPTRFADLPALDFPRPAGKVILTVGGVKYRKGTLPLVKAMAKVRQQLPDVQCVILGSTAEGSDYTQQVCEAITTLGLEDCVHLRGFVPESELLAWYGAADVFVLPSMNKGWQFEGYGLVHMEASAAGLPVIGTRGCGVEDAVEDGITGLLVSQEKIDIELPQAIIALLNDPSKRAAMGAAGKHKAQQQTWSKVAQAMLSIYQTALTVKG
jgi:glycosyltransferase involved in cell wall biosynthesis